MSKNDEFKKFLPDEEFKSPPIVYEVPSEAEIPFQERIPSGYDPMSEIQLRGRAYRGLAGGKIPWWVLITGWFIFGGIAFAILIPTAIALITSNDLFLALITSLPALFFTSILVIIMWRGTAAKLVARKSQNRR
ncbi:MAG: hypothetical protein KI793_35425 [Rivularia sp. (in: Bacteria)]|nr:hypothetical protein [Rivularia sp. MS3]